MKYYYGDIHPRMPMDLVNMIYEYVGNPYQKELIKKIKKNLPIRNIIADITPIDSMHIIRKHKNHIYKDIINYNHKNFYKSIIFDDIICIQEFKENIIGNMECRMYYIDIYKSKSIIGRVL